MTTTMAPQIAARPLGAVAQAGMFVFGIVMALVGAVVPPLSERLAIALGDVGTLFLAMNFAMLVASLVLGLIVDRFGLKLPLASGPALVALGLVLIGRAGEYAQLIPAVVALGFGGGFVNGAANTLVADLHDDEQRKAAALNLLGMFFGFGALFLPFSIGALTSTFGIAALLYAAAALCAATAIAAAALTFPPPKQRQGWPLARMPQFLGMPVVLLLGLLLFFLSGNEFTLGGYISTHLTREMGLSIGAASYALGGYWAALMATRAVLSRVLLRVSPHTVVLAGALVSAAAALLVAAAPAQGVAVAGVVLLGLALSGLFPTVLGIASARFRENSGTVFGILFTIALSGGMTMPWVAGQLAEGFGVGAAFVLAAANFVAIALIGLVVRRS
ncbi:MAG TPA: MFS transporter [Vicinamibacterales bacterium]